MKVDLVDPDLICKVYKSLAKKAQQRLVMSAVCGKQAFYDQLHIECILIAIGVETDSCVDEDNENDWY
jgi:hypothetical protein